MKRILLDASGDVVRIALMEYSELIELYIENRSNEQITGNIYVARITNILPGINSAFVDIGAARNAFFGIGSGIAGDKSIDILDYTGGNPAYEPHKKFKVGEELLVQVIKEGGRAKSPVVSSTISFAGKNIVLLPGQGYVGISKKITEAGERKRLSEIMSRLRPEGYGIIIRTNGCGASEDELETEVQRLKERSVSFLSKSAFLKAPVLLYKETDAVGKAVRDIFGEDIDEFIVNDEMEYDKACRIATEIAPRLCSRIKLYDGEKALFSEYMVEYQIEKALHKKVWLSSGGYLVIEQTEACVVIDVNTGKVSSKKDAMRSLILKTNIEAAIEIAKQLRLRNLSGIVIIDFIDMKTDYERSQVQAALEKAVAKDRVKTYVIGMTELGLMQLTRKKTHEPIAARLLTECKCCGGTGKLY